MALQIKLELLKEWEKKGKLLIIWRCERCYKKIPFYKSGNPLIDSIYLWWAKDHKYCEDCEKKLKNKNNPKVKEDTEIIKIVNLLEKYELPPEENYLRWNPLNIQKN